MSCMYLSGKGRFINTSFEISVFARFLCGYPEKFDMFLRVALSPFEVG